MRRADLVGMVSHRPFPGLPGEVGMARETRALPARWGWPERLEPYRGGGDGPRDSSPTAGGAGSGPESAHGDSGQEGGLFASKARFGRIPLPCVRGKFSAVCVGVGF